MKAKERRQTILASFGFPNARPSAFQPWDFGNPLDERNKRSLQASNSNLSSNTSQSPRSRTRAPR